MNINTLLYTKDGRIIGNAIVTEKLPDSKWKIKTDYGNEVILMEIEISPIFYIGHEHIDPYSSQYAEENIENHKHYTKLL
jgi:hypothetical protein